MHQSRYTTNSMFQRQLSTNALQYGATYDSSSSSSGVSPARHAPIGRPFQRQITASQLFSSSSSSASQVADSRQRAAALLANARSSALGGSSNLQELQSPAASSLSTEASPMNRPVRQPKGFNEAAQGQQTTNSAAAGSDQQPKKVSKNKRIISRMLSISAIHTTVASPALSNALNNDQPASSTTEFYQQHHAVEHGSSSVTTVGDQVAGETSSTFKGFRKPLFLTSASSRPFSPSPKLFASTAFLPQALSGLTRRQVRSSGPFLFVTLL